MKTFRRILTALVACAVLFALWIEVESITLCCVTAFIFVCLFLNGISASDLWRVITALTREVHEYSASLEILGKRLDEHRLGLEKNPMLKGSGNFCSIACGWYDDLSLDGLHACRTCAENNGVLSNFKGKSPVPGPGF